MRNLAIPHRLCHFQMYKYGWLLVLVVMIGSIVWQNNSYEKDNYFYKDILEIIEEEEKRK